LAPVPQDRWRWCGELIGELARVTTPAASPELAGGGGRGDRRQEPRFAPGAGGGCAVLPTVGNGAWKAEIPNLSVGGLRLPVVRPGCPLQPGRVLELTLSNAERAVRVAVRLQLTHAAERAGGDYEVGGSFDRPLRPTELEALARHE